MSKNHEDLSEHIRKNVIRKLKEKEEELGKSPTQRDVSNSLIHAARKHFGSWNRAKEKAGLKTFEFRGKKGRVWSKEKKVWSKEKIVDELKELARELGRSPVIADDRRLATAARRYFGSFNAAKEKARLKTFSNNIPQDRGEGEKVEMVKLSIRISNLADAVKIRPPPLGSWPD